MPKYLSGRVRRTPQNRLTDDRYQYLGLDQAEPNIGDPPSAAGTPNIPAGQQYQMVSVLSNPGERYWVPIQGGLIPGSISVFEEGTLVGTLSSVTQLNFRGNSLTAIATPYQEDSNGNVITPGNIATITAAPPGLNGSVLFKNLDDFATSSDLLFDTNVGILTVGKGLEVGDTGLKVGVGGTFVTVTSGIGSVGIGTTDPTQELDVDGDIRLRKKLYDYTNDPGVQGNLLANGVDGVEWISNNAVQTGAGGEIGQVQYHGNTGLVDGAPNFYFDISNKRVGIGSTQPKELLDVLGISSFTGKTHISELEGGTANFSGNVEAKSGFVANTARIADLTQTRVVFAGASGELSDDANFTYDSTTDTLNVTILSADYVSTNNIKATGVSTFSNVEIDTNTIKTTTGNLIFESFTDAIQSNATLFINRTDESTDKDTGALTVDGGVGIEKNLNVGGNFSSSGITTLASNTGLTTTGGDLYVGDNLYIKNSLIVTQTDLQNLYVTGLSTFVGFSTFKDGFTVAGVSTFNDGILVSGSSTIFGGQVIKNTGNAFLTIDSGIDATAGNQQSDIELKTNGVLRSIISVKESRSSDGYPLEINNNDNTGPVEIYHGVNSAEKRLETLSDGIKITGKLDVTTNLTVTGNSTLNGNVLLGSDNSDDISFNGKVKTNIIPDTDEDYDLGSASLKWNQVHAKEYYGTFKGIIDPNTSDDKIQKGNTKAQVVDDDDTGPEGHFFVQTGGAERLRIDSSGHVGIGSTSPDASLDIEGTSVVAHLKSTNNNYVLRIQGNNALDKVFFGTTNANDFLLANGDGGAGTVERLRITAGGKVGIGTTNPDAIIGTQNNTRLAVTGIVTALEYYGKFKGEIDDGVGISKADTVEITDDTSQSGTHYIHFGSETSGYDGVEVDSVGLIYKDGNIGIGTDNPTTALDVKGDITVSNANNQADIFFGEHGDVADSKALIRMNQLNSTSGELQFHTESGGTLAERLRIGPQGQLGIEGANYGAPGQVLTSQGNNKALVWSSKAAGDLTEIDVIQENYCGVDDTPLNPITVTPTSAGITTVSIATTSNAYGRKYVQDSDPTTPAGGNYVACDGDIWYDTDGDVPGGSMPSGSIIMYNGDVAPSGWVLCDNSAEAVAAGAPDLRDKFIVGAGSGGQGSSYNRGDTGGSANATLVTHSHTINNHKHSFTTNGGGSHSHNLLFGIGAFGGSSGAQTPRDSGTTTNRISTANNHTHGGTTNNPTDRGTSDEGSSAAGKNLPPYYALTFIMKL